MHLVATKLFLLLRHTGMAFLIKKWRYGFKLAKEVPVGGLCHTGPYLPTHLQAVVTSAVHFYFLFKARQRQSCCRPIACNYYHTQEDIKSPNCLITRHSLVRVKSEVFVLLYVFLFVFFCSVNDFSTTCGRIHDFTPSLHGGVLWFRMCLLPFWGLGVPGGRKKGKMKFSLL